MFPVLLVWAKDRLPICSAPLTSSGLLSIPSPVLDIFQCLSPVLPLFVSTSGLVYLEILSCLFLGLAVNIRPVLFTCFLLSLCFYLPGPAYLWVWSCLPPVVSSFLISLPCVSVNLLSIPACHQWSFLALAVLQETIIGWALLQAPATAPSKASRHFSLPGGGYRWIQRS